jgi:hypothetical protein
MEVLSCVVCTPWKLIGVKIRHHFATILGREGGDYVFPPGALLLERGVDGPHRLYAYGGGEKVSTHLLIIEHIAPM